jgi:prepilin-type N-terminal cleavage/methylation domain-containing protein
MPMRGSNQRPDSGFTLLELLVAVTVILILAGIFYSVGRSMLTRARIVESSTNLRSLAVANADYLADHGVYCPADDYSNNRRWHGARRSHQQKFDPRKGFLAPYLGRSMQVNYCPLLKETISGSGSFEDGTGGYGYNSSYIGGRPGASFDRNTRLRTPARPADITDPPNTVMFTTTAYARAAGLQEYAYCEPPFWDLGSGPNGRRPTPSVHFRANGKALVAWCDGHITSESPNESVGTINPHGGDSGEWPLGWFGPEENNGYWNPDFRTISRDQE